MLNELELRADIQPATIKGNFDEVKAYVAAQTEKYKNLVVTDDPAVLKVAKSDLSELTRARTSIDKFRKEQKKVMSAPITQMENQCKELISMISDAEIPLKQDIEAINDKVREKRKAEAKKNIVDTIADLGLNEKYASRLVVKDFYLNLAGTKKEVKEDIRREAESLLRMQEQEILDKQLIREAVDAENATLPTPMDADMYLSQYESGSPLPDLLTRIRSSADNMRRAAKAAAEEAERRVREEEERKRREEESARKAREEAEEKARLAREAEFANAQAEFAKVQARLAEEQEKTAKAQADAEKAQADAIAKAVEEERKRIRGEMANAQVVPNDPVPAVSGNAVSSPVPMPGYPSMLSTGKEEEWAVTLKVIGKRAELGLFNQFLKDNGIQYQILGQEKLLKMVV